MKFPSRVFNIAGVYGIIALLPMYFTETRFGIEHPPAITHSEFYYGFIGVALAWQFAFFLIARDPVRYRAGATAGVRLRRRDLRGTVLCGLPQDRRLGLI